MNPDVKKLSRRDLLAATAASAGALVAAGSASAASAAPSSASEGDLVVAGGSTSGSPPHVFTPWPAAPLYSTAFYRLVGEAAAGGADFEEVFFAVQRIGAEPTAQAWTRELAGIGRTLMRQAHALQHRDRLLSRATALRGQNYLRAAEYFISPQGPSLPAKVAMYRELRAGFALAALGGGSPAVRAVRVPYLSHRLYGYLVEPVARRTPAPAVLFFGGSDTIGEQLLLKAALRFAERGMATLILDGPGMGATLRFLRLPGRYDYERVAKAGLDWLQSISWIDARRIAIVGLSLGGYYAARSAAFERRARACVVWSGPFNLTTDAASSGEAKDPESSAKLVSQFLWAIGGNSHARLAAQFPKFDLSSVVRRITCPTLLIYGADDDLVPVDDARRIYDELRCPKSMHLVPSGSPGATHCQSDSLPAAWEPMLPWLDEQLQAGGRRH
jgi:dienelactone hydrolase